MDFIIVGGGWYGSFYTRQLLRGVKINFDKLHVVDHDPHCQLMQEFGNHERVVFHHQDWKEYLTNYLEEQLTKRKRGEEITDRYAPPCIAPHILLELFLERAAKEDPTLRFSTVPFKPEVGTPVDRTLSSGHRALSFATWTCPYSCIEPPTCPHTRGPKDWDMKDYLTHYFKTSALQPNSTHLFQCRHYAMGVGTIPVAEIVDEFLSFQKVVRTPGPHLSVMATISSCHGLMGLVESTHV